MEVVIRRGTYGFLWMATGLQKQLMQAVEQEIAQRGPQILLCTVHSDNHLRLNNFLAQGYSIAQKLPMYGSVRYILRKDLP